MIHVYFFLSRMKFVAISFYHNTKYRWCYSLSVSLIRKSCDSVVLSCYEFFLHIENYVLTVKLDWLISWKQHDIPTIAKLFYYEWIKITMVRRNITKIKENDGTKSIETMTK